MHLYATAQPAAYHYQVKAKKLTTEERLIEIGKELTDLQVEAMLNDTEVTERELDRILREMQHLLEEIKPNEMQLSTMILIQLIMSDITNLKQSLTK